jgi:hypothetical protein
MASINNIPNTQGKIISSFNTFGLPEDYIELNVYDNTNILIAHIRDFKNYTFTEEGKTTEGLSNEVVVNPTQNLKDLNFNNGQFILEYRFQRKKIENTFKKIFFIKEISNSRTEIRIDNNDFSNEVLEQRYKIFENELATSSVFKDFTLNFGNGINITAVNISLDKSQDNFSILVKLLEPLPLTIANTFTFRIVEDLIEPAIININLESPLVEDEIIPIAGPNFKIDTRLNSSVPSGFKTYDEIIGGSITSSFENMTNALSSSFEPSVDYDNLITDSGYHFENFVHFSSAVERLNNFKYKLSLIELYNTQIANINTISGGAASSITVTNSKKFIEDKKKKVIGGFDGYERFLYFESGTYSWPKSNSIKPYIQEHTTSSKGLEWFGSNEGANSVFGGQIYSASQFDNQNVYNLNKLIPEYIKNDSNNNQYKLFIDMVGQHFDQSWLYIKSLTENKKAENKLNRGIDKDLVYNALKGLGIQVFDEFENEDLFGYLTGINKDGSILHQTGSSITLVSSSNDGSLPKADITKEKWKRIYHNLPYLLKTKGTERGIRALITSYGIPSTILNIKEFGGSTTDSTTFKTFNHDKFTYALDGGTTGTDKSYFIKLSNWDGIIEQTVKFRVKPFRSNTPYLLFALSGSSAAQPNGFRVELHPHTGSTDINVFGDRTKYGRLKTVSGSEDILGSSNLFTIYDGDFWDISLRKPSGSNNITCSAYKTTDSSLNIHSESFQHTLPNLLWNDTNEEAYIGGITGSSGYLYKTYSGSIQNVLIYNEVLTDKTLEKHALTPSMYAGNFTSSFRDSQGLQTRIPLGGNLKTHSLSTGGILPNESLKNIIAGSPSSSISASIGDITNLKYRSFTETHHLITPDTVGKSMTSEKVRLDSGEVEDNILSYDVKTETSVLDRQPTDSNDLGVYFSPTFEVNKDIIYKLGSFRLDDFIGDPTHINENSYPDLKNLSNIYFKNVSDLNDSGVSRFKYTDFIDITKQFDHTLFKIIESMVPAKVNLKTGILIEPHYLERTKFGNPSTLPGVEKHNNYEANYDIKYTSETSDFNLSGQNLITEVNYNIKPESQYVSFDTGSNPLLNNTTSGRISKKYFKTITSNTEEF